MTRKLCLSGTVVLVLLFAYFVWPTPWAYYTSAVTRDVMRRNRITDAMQIYTAGEWVEFRPRRR